MAREQDRPKVARFMRGTALVAEIPHGHWETSTFIGALRQDRIVAPCGFDSPIDADTLTAWVEQRLVPDLKPNDVVILDDPSSLKDPRARRAIRVAGARLSVLPPYSPDLNPIQMVLAKLKTPFQKSRHPHCGGGLAQDRRPAPPILSQ